MSKRKYLKNSFYTKKKNRRRGKMLETMASVLLLFLEFVRLTGSAGLSLLAFVSWPLRYLARIFFHGFVVKIYAIYLSLLRRIGWYQIEDGLLSFLFNRRLSHIILVFLTVILVYSNASAQVGAEDANRRAARAPLADFVSGEFDDFDAGSEDLQEILPWGSDAEFQARQYYGAYSKNGSSFIEENNHLILAQGASVLSPRAPATTKVSKRQRKSIIYYTVEAGDTISVIAQKFEISVYSVLWENGLSARSLIRPGDRLAILPQSGVSHKVTRGETLSSIAKKYGISAIEIEEANKEALSLGFRIDTKLFIPGGRMIAEPVPVRSRALASGRGDAGRLGATSSDKRPLSAAPASGSKMNWPTVGNRITQYYSWRHTGLDIANKVGTPLYAADSGTVELVGWGSGYGNMIVVNHGGGKKTRYAHLSKFYVSKGDKVRKGETIGAMGNTGWSTGPHLHFEVIVNGTKYNPLNYIK